MINQSALRDYISKIIEVGPFAVMIQNERDAGNTILVPGISPLLPLGDWPPDIVVSQSGNNVRIVAIKALKPGDGAFGRLVTAIAKANLTPVIVEPMLDMPRIMERWGWRVHIQGEGFEKQRLWTPTPEWLAERAKQ